MPEPFEFTKEKLVTDEGIAELNRMMRFLHEAIAGDGETVKEFYGYGSPEGVVAANVGSTYRRLDGSTTTTLYVKTAGSDASGWTPK